jgi:glycosyltransferase involved in cell wall biosynthesis
MASGLPVVCSARGGYSDYLEDGRDSRVFETTAQAVHAIFDLRANPNGARAMGAAARRSARRIVGEGLHARTRRFLLCPA